MAIFTYTANYNNLSNWPGQLLESDGSSALLAGATRTATTATIKHGAADAFANYTLNFTGTGFTYSGNEVTGGTLTGLTVKNAGGAVVFSISGINAAALGSDFSMIAFYVLGTTDPDGNTIGRNGQQAWSMLLSGNDTINGTAGDDNRSLIGMDAGNDTYNMLGGNDYMSGGLGTDTYNGGTGFDTLTFEETTFNNGLPAIRGITVTHTAAGNGTVLDPWGATDSFNSVEGIIGSRFKDTYTGSAGRDEFSGLAGADIINGGADRDTVRYDSDVWHGGKFGIKVNLTTGRIVDGFGYTDIVSNVERIVGTKFADSFIGSANKDQFVGDLGKDSYDGQGNAVTSAYDGDMIIFDWQITNVNPSSGINVDLALATNQIINDGYGNTEIATNIEGISGGRLNDTIKGNAAANYIAGDDGKDIMTGRGGNDIFEWWDRAHFNDGDEITDFVRGADKIAIYKSDFGGTATWVVENDLVANTTNTTIQFDNATDKLYIDFDGSGAAARFEIVKLTGLSAVALTDFILT